MVQFPRCYDSISKQDSLACSRTQRRLANRRKAAQPLERAEAF